MLRIDHAHGVILLEGGIRIEAIDARDAVATDLVEQAAHAEGAGDGGHRSGQQHARQTADLDGQLHLVGLVHADAGGIVAGER